MNIEPFIGPACLIVGVLLGAWLHHRATQRLSPLPDVAGAMRAVMAAITRKKSAKKEPKRMRA